MEYWHIILYRLPGALIVPIIHSWVKAAMSARLGDPTPKNKGFFTKNPLVYFETIGFAFMIIFGYGWGQPVPTSPLYYKDRRNDALLVNIVPSIVSLLIGIAVAAAAGVLSALTVPFSFTDSLVMGPTYHIFMCLYHFAFLNVGMAFFSLIPVYPLNGARILQVFLKPETIAKMTHSEKILQMFLIILLAMRIIPFILDPLVYSILGVSLITSFWMQ